jgi:hypothetical protein
MSTQTMQSKTGKPIKFTDLEPSKISFEAVLETDTKSPQKYGFMRYDGKKFATQTPELVLRVGGIPQFNPTYHKKTEVEDRGYAKLPLDEEHSGGKSMLEKVKEIDEYFEAHQDVVFGENSKYYQYVPLLRYPNVDEEEQPKEVKNSKYPPLPKLPYIRAKLDFDNTTKLLKTQLILREESGDLTNPVVEHVDDIRQHFRLNCEYRAIMTFSKYWVAKTKKSSGKDAKKEWGVSLKITKLQVKTRSMTKNEPVSYDFDDDSDEQPSEVKQVVKKQTKTVPVEPVEPVETVEAEEADETEQTEEVTEEQEGEEEDLEPVSKRQPKKVVEAVKPKGKATSKATGKKTSKLDL